MNLCAKALSWLCTSTWNHNCINTKRQTHIILCTKPTIEGRCGLAEQIKYSPEYHFHVPGGAPAPHPPLHVSLTRRGDEVVTLTRLELHLHWRRRERSASDKLFTEMFKTIDFNGKLLHFLKASLIITYLKVIVKYIKFLGWSQTAIILGFGLIILQLSYSILFTL